MTSEPDATETKPDDDFADHAQQAQPGLIREFLDFLCCNKKWWLTPIVVFLVLLGLLIVLSEGSAVAPFIYALF